MFASAKCLAVFACFVLPLESATDRMAQARPPQILEIYRDYLKPDAVAANRKLEKRAENLCRTLDFRPLI